MATKDNIAGLAQRLRQEGAGPLIDLSNNTASAAFVRRIENAASRVRRQALPVARGSLAFTAAAAAAGTLSRFRNGSGPARRPSWLRLFG